MCVSLSEIASLVWIGAEARLECYAWTLSPRNKRPLNVEQPTHHHGSRGARGYVSAWGQIIQMYAEASSNHLPTLAHAIFGL